MRMASIVMIPLLLLFLAIWAGLIYLLILLIRALRKYLRGGEARREEQGRNSRRKKGGDKPAAKAHEGKPQEAKGHEAKSSAKKKRRDRGAFRGGRGPVLPMKSGAVKDSTEQPSLMKPYYLSD